MPMFFLGQSGNFGSGCKSGDCENSLSKYVWANGDIYFGDYSDGRRDGYGTYTYSDGRQYRGYWKSGMKDGSGSDYNKYGELIRSGKFKSGTFLYSTNQAPKTTNKTKISTWKPAVKKVCNRKSKLAITE